MTFTTPLRNLLDYPNQLVRAVAELASQLDQFPRLVHHEAALGGRTGDRHPTATGELQDALIAKGVQRPEDRVRVDPQYRGEVPSRRQPFARFRLTVCDGSADGSRNLFVQGAQGCRGRFPPSGWCYSHCDYTLTQSGVKSSFKMPFRDPRATTVGVMMPMMRKLGGGRGSGHDSDGRCWDKFGQPSDDDSSRQQHDDVVGGFELDIPAHRLGARRG